MNDSCVINSKGVCLRGDKVLTNVDDLVSMAQGGDSHAFSLLYQEYVRSIYQYIYVRVDNNSEQAEDLTQEVFLKALDNLGKYKFRGKPFTSWLFRIAHNLVIDYYRRSSKNRASTITESTIIVAEENPAMEAERSAELNELKKAIEQLPSQQKEVISLRFVSGLSIAETADIIGKTSGNVKKLQHVALVKLKKIMNNV